MSKYDVVIIGAGIYGLYASLNKVFYNKKILIVEKEPDILTRASYINQARLHNGYHYPRSIPTAKTSAQYFERFYKDYEFAINKEFKSIYAISKENSYVSKEEFEEFCEIVNIPYKKVNSNDFFKNDTVSSTYETKEYVYDINLIRQNYKEKIFQKGNIEIKYETYIEKAEIDDLEYKLILSNGEIIRSECVINTSYASVNQINELFKMPKYDIKYELCELELGKVNKLLRDTAITIMDGPFFSIMPFGKSNYHSLTSVNHTPHTTCYKDIPEFECQSKNSKCNNFMLDNCNNCKYKPESKKKEMVSLLERYLKDDYKFIYQKSLFTIKPILLSSEKDDSRPTIIRKHRERPTFISCLSGKFNTIYLLDEFLEENFER